MKKYIITFQGISSPIHKNRTNESFENNNIESADSLEEIRLIVEKHYHIARPKEFETFVSQAFENLNSTEFKNHPKWGKPNMRYDEYLLVSNSGNPYLKIWLQEDYLTYKENNR